MTLATTVDALVERVRRDSLLASRGPVFTVGASYTAGGTTITTAETFTNIGPGSLLSVEYEMMYVQGANSSTKTITVIPGYFGSTQADHAAGVVMEVDARFPKAALLDHLQHEIMSWRHELWREEDLPLDLTVSERTYDLVGITGDIFFLLDVRQQPTGGSTFWNFSWTGDAWPHLSARLLRNMPIADFPSSYALQLQQNPTHSSDARVMLARPLDATTLIGTTDLDGDVGVRIDWLDIAELGTKWRALTSAVIGRSDWRTSNVIRSAEEVSALDTIRAVSTFKEMRDARFANAAMDLRANFPFRQQ